MHVEQSPGEILCTRPCFNVSGPECNPRTCICLMSIIRTDVNRHLSASLKSSISNRCPYQTCPENQPGSSVESRISCSGSLGIVCAAFPDFSSYSRRQIPHNITAHHHDSFFRIEFHHAPPCLAQTLFAAPESRRTCPQKTSPASANCTAPIPRQLPPLLVSIRRITRRPRPARYLQLGGRCQRSLGTEQCG